MPFLLPGISNGFVCKHEVRQKKQKKKQGYNSGDDTKHEISRAVVGLALNSTILC